MASKTADGKADYHKYIFKDKRSAVDVLFDFFPNQDIKLPLEYLIQLCGR